MGLHVSHHLAERWRQRIAETCALAGALILSSVGPAPVVDGRRWLADPIAHRRHCWRNRTRLVKLQINSMDAGMTDYAASQLSDERIVQFDMSLITQLLGFPHDRAILDCLTNAVVLRFNFPVCHVDPAILDC